VVFTKNRCKIIYKKNFTATAAKIILLNDIWQRLLYKNRYKQFAAVFNKTVVKLCSALNNSGYTTAAN
jgi:hypothetical protein